MKIDKEFNVEKLKNAEPYAIKNEGRDRGGREGTTPVTTAFVQNVSEG